MSDQSLRTQVIELAKLRADAIAQGNIKKADECAHRIQAKQLHQMVQGTCDERIKILAVNMDLEFFDKGFDPKHLEQATTIEGWGTNFSCPEEFTFWVLIGPNGYMAHRIIKGY